MAAPLSALVTHRVAAVQKPISSGTSPAEASESGCCPLRVHHCTRCGGGSIRTGAQITTFRPPGATGSDPPPAACRWDGDYIVGYGEEGDWLYVVEDGTVQLIGVRWAMGAVQPGTLRAKRRWENSEIKLGYRGSRSARINLSIWASGSSRRGPSSTFFPASSWAGSPPRDPLK